MMMPLRRDGNAREGSAERLNQIGDARQPHDCAIVEVDH
jgi:hypothetical protein